VVGDLPAARKAFFYSQCLCAGRGHVPKDARSILPEGCMLLELIGRGDKSEF
jgi:hypothetical protein